ECASDRLKDRHSVGASLPRDLLIFQRSRGKLAPTVLMYMPNFRQKKAQVADGNLGLKNA
ncbi:MAG: hypothetical protein ACTJGN_21040, partial [Pseudomonas helleri]|uniref:hypothetical protein n=1 Tax=Pseudomonas helleri TaxID=1608996 RepID=UPI003F9C5F98